MCILEKMFEKKVFTYFASWFRKLWGSLGKGKNDLKHVTFSLTYDCTKL